MKADRGARVPLNEKTYALVDELEVIAKAHDSTVAAVALAWVQKQPSVTWTIIGARRLAQLEDNVKALDATLTAEDFAHLDALTKPTFGFPQNMQSSFPRVPQRGHVDQRRLRAANDHAAWRQTLLTSNERAS